MVGRQQKQTHQKIVDLCSDSSDSDSDFLTENIENFRLETQSISDFKELLLVIKAWLEGINNVTEDQQFLQNNISTMRESFVKLLSKSTLVRELEELKGNGFGTLGSFLVSGELPFELDLAAENVALINHLARIYCMVSVNPNTEQDIEEKSIWKTMTYILNQNQHNWTGKELFFSSFYSYMIHGINDEEGMIRIIRMDPTQRDLLLLSHLATSIHHDLYTYSVFSAQDCVRLEPTLTVDEFLNQTSSRNMPGDALLNNLKCISNIEKCDTTKLMIVAYFGQSIFPLIIHNEQDEIDITKLVTFKTTYKNGAIVSRVGLEGNMESMFSTLLLKNCFAINGEDTGYKMEMVCGRSVKMPHAVPIEFENMNAADLGKRYNDKLNQFGVVTFRATNFSSVRPWIKKPYESEKMKFDVQIVKKIPDVKGMYIVSTEGGEELTVSEAKERAHNLFQKMPANELMEQYLVCTADAFEVTTAGKEKSRIRRTVTSNNKPSTEKKYLYAAGEKVPFISDWSKHAEKILNPKTSTLQGVNEFNKIDGVTTHHYYVSAFNSIFRAHVENRGLNAANFLLTGVKYWAVLPKRQYPAFVKWLELALGIKNFNQCPNWFQHKLIFFDIGHIPEYFDLTFIVQQPGDLVLLDNYAIHWGWNVEFNVAISYNWSNNPSWDMVQHFMPVCTHVDVNCSVPILTTEELLLIRKTDGLLTDSSIPVNHLVDPKFNFYTTDWRNPFPTQDTLDVPELEDQHIPETFQNNDSSDLEILSEGETNQDSAEDSSEEKESKTKGESSASTPESSTLSKSKRASETAEGSDLDEPTCSTKKRKATNKKTSIYRLNSVHNLSKAKIKCCFCDTRRGSYGSLYNHIYKRSDKCKANKDKIANFTLIAYWKEEVEKLQKSQKH